MYLIIREVNGKIEYLKDSNSTSNKVFDDHSRAEIFIKKINARTSSDKQWRIMKAQDNSKLLSTER